MKVSTPPLCIPALRLPIWPAVSSRHSSISTVDMLDATPDEVGFDLPRRN
jgi:hypothetical protein